MKRLNLPEERIFTAPAIFWKRAAAFAIDMVILNFAMFPFWRITSSFMPSGASFWESVKAAENNGYLMAVSFSMSLLILLYFFLLEARIGQSIGKHIMNLFIASDRKKIETWQVLVRNLIFALPLVFWLVDFAAVFFTGANQRIFEMMSRTRVVEQFRID